ncbi:hypothetical protein NL676_005564 [Syzygium grande]|nr:hypothetical protein NL676_005564 [Syzygium grande]
MGIYKFLNLQMIPWCFHLMGNHISCVQLQPEPSPPPPPSADDGTVKVIHSDGLVKTYHRPIRASELMAQFPKHLVCRSDSFYIGQKIPALSEHDFLQLGHKYFLLPRQFFQSVLTFVTIASFVASQKPQDPSTLPRDGNSSRNAFLRKAAGCQPFDIQRTPSGCLRIRVSDEFISQLMEEGGRGEKEASSEGSSGDGEQKPVGRVCTTPQLERDYSQLVGSSRRWEPKLETIRESDKKSRSSSSFGMKRRKKQPPPPSKVSAQNHKIQKSSESHVHAAVVVAATTTAASTKPSYRARIKIRSRK